MRTFVRMVCILVCLLVIPTVCFAQTQEEWNMSCTYKTSRSVKLYQYPKEEGDYIGTLPANTYVVIQSTMDGYKAVSWKLNGSSGYGWVEASALVRCTSTVRGGSGYADSVHELDPNHDKILASRPVVNVAESLLLQGDKDYSKLNFENPDSKAAAEAQLTAGRNNNVSAESMNPSATAAPATLKSAPKAAGTTETATSASRPADAQTEHIDDSVQINLVQLGTYTSVIQHEGYEMELPTAKLQFSSDVPELKRIAYIYAPRTGRCYLRAKASDKGEILDKCKAGTVVQVVKYTRNYCQIVYDDQVGYVQTACLRFADPTAEPIGIWRLSYNGKLTGNGQVPLRNDKSNDSAIIVKLRSGTKVTVFAKTGKWYEVEYEGLHGYVHQNFLSPENIIE